LISLKYNLPKSFPVK